MSRNLGNQNLAEQVANLEIFIYYDAIKGCLNPNNIVNLSTIRTRLEKAEPNADYLIREKLREIQKEYLQRGADFAGSSDLDKFLQATERCLADYNSLPSVIELERMRSTHIGFPN